MESIVAAIPAAAAASFLVVREAWRAWQPARLLLAGRYPEARSAAESLEKSWMRHIPGVPFSARYAVACALHFEGDLEGSLAATSALDRARLPAASRYAVDSLDAASLVLLEREPGRALALLESAAKIQRLPTEDELLKALASQALGVTGFDLPTETPSGDRAAIASFLRGLYLVRAGQPSSARRDLLAAANAPHANVYTRRARILLAERPLEEGPSSLDPQVVTKRADQD